jgi:hypothetical protein
MTLEPAIDMPRAKRSIHNVTRPKPVGMIVMRTICGN